MPLYTACAETATTRVPTTLPPTPLPATESARSVDALTRRERFFFDLYRVLEAVALVGLTFAASSSLLQEMSPKAAKAVALGYLVASAGLFVVGRWLRGDARPAVLLGLLLDVLVAVAAVFVLRGFDSQIATLLLVNLSCGALLLPVRSAFLLAGIASAAIVAAFGFASSTLEGWSEGILFAMGYMAATVLCQLLRGHLAETQSLAQRREIDLANLTQLNDLIIRRMRTGVLVVDSANRVHRINESAWHLLGNPSPKRTELGDIAPELSRRLYHWRTARKPDTLPVALAEGMPEVIPRFATLTQHDEENVLIFLDDISLLSRQAEQLTLSSLGRLSASIAHEIRNPLASISYSAQLLSESEDIPEPDHRLVEIIRAQCTRMNAIVENILQLSRRERSRPEQVDLAQWIVAFVEDFRNSQPPDVAEVKAIATPSRGVHATVDVGQLHQIAWNLVQNALRYGRHPQEPARVSIVARRPEGSSGALLEVVDRGPGIPKRVAEQIFEPFFTTSEHGTGLGLYIARQLCEANQATIEYVPVAGGGSCFRIAFPAVAVPARAAVAAATNGPR